MHSDLLQDVNSSLINHITLLFVMRKKKKHVIHREYKSIKHIKLKLISDMRKQCTGIYLQIISKTRVLFQRIFLRRLNYLLRFNKKERNLFLFFSITLITSEAGV